MAQATTKRAAAPANNKPVKVFRARGMKASVFENHTTQGEQDVTYHKVSLQRIYKEGDEFKTTTSFGRDDLPVARHLLQRAWEFILDAEAPQSKDATEE